MDSIEILIKKLELILKNKSGTLLLPIVVDHKELECYIIDQIKNVDDHIIVYDVCNSNNLFEEMNYLVKNEFACITNLSIYLRQMESFNVEKFYESIEFARDAVFLKYKARVLLILDSFIFRDWIKFADDFYSYCIKGFDFSVYDKETIENYLLQKVKKM